MSTPLNQYRTAWFYVFALDNGLVCEWMLPKENNLSSEKEKLVSKNGKTASGLELGYPSLVPIGRD